MPRLPIHFRLRRRAGREAIEAQLRAAEERYRLLVETLPLATYVDRSGGEPGVDWISPQIERITSYPAEEWISDPYLFRKVLHPHDLDRVLAEMDRVRQTGEGVDHEYRLVRRDGSVVWIHDLAINVEEDGERFARGFIVDVTDRREADRMKDEFVALVSHELRTPLTSIRGYLELMQEDSNLTDEQKRHLKTVDRNADRLQRVVGDLLFVAQVEAGRLTLERRAVDLNEIVREAIDACSPTAAAKEVELATELGQLPELTGDRARLAQVLDNLISNAVKFTPGGGRVTVCTTHTEDTVELAVMDTGMGISEDELPKLFQRFFRTERATVTAIPGTGLGLAIARAIVEGHAGQIEVASVEGEGTTFRVSLPL
jgi:PAS domain S-box-containing protein